MARGVVKASLGLRRKLLVYLETIGCLKAHPVVSFFIYLYVYLSTPFLWGSVANELTQLMIKRHHYVHRTIKN